MPCRITRTKEWSVRLMHELSSWENATFVTLTYSEENLPSDNSLSKLTLQRFIKRLRKNAPNGLIKHYSVGEYGELTGRAHYHSIIYNLSIADREYIQKTWGLGHIMAGTVTPDSTRYVAGYIQKKLYISNTLPDPYQGRVSPFSISSQGLGLSWANSNADYLRNNQLVTVRGVKHSVPRYYAKKLQIDFDDNTDVRSADYKERWEAYFQTNPSGPQETDVDKYRRMLQQTERNLKRKGEQTITTL